MDAVHGDGEGNQVTNNQQVINGLSAKQQQVLLRWLSHESSSINSAETRKRLIAYVTGNTDGDQLREYLSDRLPNFMIPDSISVVDAIPRLANGKTDFNALPDPILRSDESADAIVLPRNPIEQTLAKIWQDLLHTELVSVHDNFFEVGGDSIISIQVVSRAREAGLNVEPQDLAKYPTIADLATIAATQTTPELDPATADNSLTPIQSWFLGRGLSAPHHWNQTRLLELPTWISADTLQKAISRVVTRHDSLRATFEQVDSMWIQSTSPSVEPTLEILPFASPDAVDNSLLHELQLQFDLGTGPLIKFVLLEFADQSPSRILIIAHHLVIDHVSWSILINDLRRESQGLADGDSPDIHSTTTVAAWMYQLEQYAKSDTCRDTIEYWTTFPAGTRFALPTDHPESSTPDESTAEVYRSSLNKAQTEQLLTKTSDAYNTRVDEIIITAIGQALLHWTDSSHLRVDLERHGREPVVPGVDLSNTIGWFTSFFPVTLGLTERDDPSHSIKEIKEQLRSIPNNGIDYGLLKCCSSDETLVRAIEDTQPAEILINYLGVSSASDSNLAWKQLDTTIENNWDRAPSNLRSHLLEINAGVWDGCLTILWTFSRAVHHRSTIESLATDFLSKIVLLIEHCQDAEAGGMTPTDFPESGLDQDELDELLDEIE